jgi:glycosyltransferase involved in cell wall biosynthesis
MRIAYLSTFYPFRGGIAQFNAALKSALEQQGHEVEAFTFTTQYPKLLFPGETQMVKPEDNVKPIPSKRLLNSINPFTYQKTAARIKAYEPDLLIMKYWMSFFGPSLGYVSGKMSDKTSSIAILDNVIPHEKRFFDTAFTKYFLKRVDGFVSMSGKVKDDLLSLTPNAKVELIPHPLYDHFGKILDKKTARKQLKLHPNKKTLLFFGFIRDYKGLDLLINAFNKLNDSYQLVIAGESYGSFEKYDELISNSINYKNIHKFVRYISDQEVPLFFSAADVCILPYRSATQSGITGISYHFELPMIATNTGGLAEIIHHKETGIIVEKPEVELILQGIESYFNNYNTEDFTNNIRNIKQELSWEEMAKKIIKFAKQL